MPFVVNLEGKQLRLDDLTSDDLQTIADKHGIKSWVDIVTAPASNGKVASELIRLAASTLDVKAPEAITGRVILDVFDFVPDDLPDEYEEGLPKAEAEAETT